MWLERAKYINSIYGSGLFHRSEKSTARFGKVFETVFPVNLPETQDPFLISIRKTANNYRKIWFVSLLLTFVVPILMYKLLVYLL